MNFILHPQLAADSITIGEFPVSLLIMIKDAAYPWFVLVPQISDLKDAYQLSKDQHMQVTRESRVLCTALMAGFLGEKMNVAALGNMVPQLHIHHIVRRKNDAAWPAPVWGHQSLTPMTTDEVGKRVELVKQNAPEGLRFIGC